MLRQSFKGDVLKSREHHHQRGTYSIFCPSNASGLFGGVFDFRDWSRNLYFTLNCIQLLLKQRALPAQEIKSYPKALRNVVAFLKCLPPSQAALCQGHPRLTNSHKRITFPTAASGPAAPRESGSKGKTSPWKGLVQAGLRQSSLPTPRYPWHQGWQCLAQCAKHTGFSPRGSGITSHSCISHLRAS